MLMDLIEIGAGALGVYGIINFSSFKKKKKGPDEYGSYEWSWRRYDVLSGKTIVGFRCVKCTSISGNMNKLCTCYEYPNEHFCHTCEVCNYKMIIRTADDL